DRRAGMLIGRWLMVFAAKASWHGCAFSLRMKTMPRHAAVAMLRRAVPWGMDAQDDDCLPAPPAAGIAMACSASRMRAYRH
ncbi:MAG: hypothetical protein ACYCZI_10560, partial [Metallibacterium scheffleri]